MTFLEAIEAIEKKVDKLGIRFKDGTRMPPVVALGKIGVFHGRRFDFVVDSLDQGLISVDVYFMEMIKMITEYHSRDRESVWE